MEAAFFRNWTDQMRRGLLELSVLNDIRRHGTYGYEMEKRFCKSCGLLMGNGAIYRILRRFAEHRLVKTAVVKSPDGPNRKYYRLTKAGQRTLDQMNGYWAALKRQADNIIEKNG